MQRLQRLSVLLLLVASVTAPTACRNRPGDGGDNNGNDNGNDGGNGNAELTDRQKAAVDDVVTHLEATAMALAGLVDGFGGEAEPQGLVHVGECPVVTFETVDGSVVVTLDFGDGCTNDYFEEVSASGGIALDFGILSGSLDVNYDNFTVDGKTTSGSLDFEVTRENAQRTLTGSIELAITGVGSVSGSMEIEIDLAQGVLTVVDASWVLTHEDDDMYSAELDGVIIAPIDNGSFIPEAGTVTFQYPGEGRGSPAINVAIEFDLNSPIDGTVGVTIEETTIEYELPAVP